MYTIEEVVFAAILASLDTNAPYDLRTRSRADFQAMRSSLFRQATVTSDVPGEPTDIAQRYRGETDGREWVVQLFLDSSELGVYTRTYSAVLDSVADGGEKITLAFDTGHEYSAAKKALFSSCSYHRADEDSEYYSGSEGDEDEGPSKRWAVEIRRR